ncbi:hypothetical protein FRC04_005042 [Tulasnella sp. 424]|nr:hypothetical protein FRC04_005042 [Tulasnella sp. 424]
MVPTPAAAPNSSSNSANPPPRRGVLKVISTQSGKIFYLGKPGGEGKCNLTADIAKALLVLVDVQGNPHIIEEANSITMKSSYCRESSPFRITAWDISAGGDIIPTWFQDNHKTSLGVFIDEQALEITIAADSNTYAGTWEEESQGPLN